ncbi:MAG TPA: AAA family ATPase [Arthrobacter sp.]
MIITVGSLKGGVSKSTTAVNTAVELTRLGHRVALVDADPNTTTSVTWANDRDERSPELPRINGFQRKGNLRTILLDMDRDYDVVIVDVGGYDSREMRTAATASDLLVVPMTPSPVDLDPLAKFMDLLQAIKDLNPGLVARGLMTQVPTQSLSRRLDDAKAILADYPELPLLDTVMHRRNAYVDVMPVGRGVVEWTDYKAKAEVQLIVQEMMTYGD